MKYLLCSVNVIELSRMVMFIVAFVVLLTGCGRNKETQSKADAAPAMARQVATQAASEASAAPETPLACAAWDISAVRRDAICGLSRNHPGG